MVVASIIAVPADKPPGSLLIDTVTTMSEDPRDLRAMSLTTVADAPAKASDDPHRAIADLGEVDIRSSNRMRRGRSGCGGYSRRR